MLRAPVNPADLLAIEGRYAFAIEENVPLGAEGAGIVEDIGDEIVDLQPADLVLPLERGNWCRYRMMERAGCSI